MRANVIEIEPQHAAQPVVVVVMPAQQAGDGGPVYDVQDAGDVQDAQIDIERVIARSITVSAALCLALLLWR